MTNTPPLPSVEKSRISGHLRPLAAQAVALSTAAVVLWPEVAAACSVCLGDPDSQMAVGVNNGILVLLGCVAVVQVGFFALFWSFRNRARRLERRRDRFSLIEGGFK